MIFVDTGAWYAMATPSDRDHQRAKAFISANTEPLVTSDYIVDESLTLFIVRGQKSKGIQWRRGVLEAGGTKLARISEEDFAHALQVYEQFADKQWSFTDCTSYVLMQRLALTKAFAFDDHFRQFGTATILPAD